MVSAPTHAMGLVEVLVPAAAVVTVVAEGGVGVLEPAAVEGAAGVLSSGVAVLVVMVAAVEERVKGERALAEEVDRRVCCCRARPIPMTWNARPMPQSSIPWPRRPRKALHGPRATREGKRTWHWSMVVLVHAPMSWIEKKEGNCCHACARSQRPMDVPPPPPPRTTMMLKPAGGAAVNTWQQPPQHYCVGSSWHRCPNLYTQVQLQE